MGTVCTSPRRFTAKLRGLLRAPVQAAVRPLVLWKGHTHTNFFFARCEHFVHLFISFLLGLRGVCVGTTTPRSCVLVCCWLASLTLHFTVESTPSSPRFHI
jgi:hypothetical protein